MDGIPQHCPSMVGLHCNLQFNETGPYILQPSVKQIDKQCNRLILCRKNHMIDTFTNPRAQCLTLMLVTCAVFEDSKQLWSYRDLKVSTALYLVMRISIVILYLIVFMITMYIKTSAEWHFCTCCVSLLCFVHSCNVSFYFHIILSLTIIYGNFVVASLWQSNPVVQMEGVASPGQTTSRFITRVPAKPYDGPSCAA